MEPFYTLLAILAIALLFGTVLARVEGLTLFAPKRTKRIAHSALEFCQTRCRTPEGICPLTGTADRAADCPLWKYVRADVPTAVFGSPFMSHGARSV